MVTKALLYQMLIIFWNPKIGFGADEVTLSAPELFKFSHSRC